MSPHCPKCLGLAAEGEKRCPLDQHFFHRRTCSVCEQDMYPRELYCAACGSLNREPVEALLIPPGAGPRRILAAMGLDFLSFSLLGWLLTASLGLSFALLLALGMSLLYRTLGRSGGRQTFGQAVFHTVTIDSEAGPTTLLKALFRTVWEIVTLPRLLVASQTVVEDLERKCLSLEVTLA